MDVKIRQQHFKINPGENTEAWEYINTGLWESHTFNILDFFVKKNNTILDIGSWSGVISLYIADKAKMVYAIDPDPVCYQELLANLELNPLLAKKIKPYQIAISDKRELLRLSAREKYGQSSSSILMRRRDHENSAKINTLSLLDFIEEESIKEIDFIKMDVEGAEFRILPKIGEALKKLKYPTLYLSFHYNFLNEHIYYQHINSRFICKLILKIEKLLKFNFFRKKLNAKIKDLFKDLNVYQYIYTTDGRIVSIKHIQEYPEFIKNHDLIFTNKKWN